MRISVSVAACAAVGVLCLTGGCGVVGTGVRVSGPIPAHSAPGPSHSAPGSSPQAAKGTTTRTIDAVEVLRDDPGVSEAAKEAVAQPCARGYAAAWYPVYVRYRAIPGTEIPIALVNVQGCADSVACTGVIGGYIYRLWADRAERIYETEDGTSRVAWFEGNLVVERATWGEGSSVSRACPRDGPIVRTELSWDGERLTSGDGG